ncbi:LLM class flavin-dependent oxidoreductase [Terrabacter terrigena]|uniref:LLM class flavin-dependent oxidoreductase n=1 Tax=Terrabacter terrigena TaxID=574718 RepID=A0ABW3N151_9MICO
MSLGAPGRLEMGLDTFGDIALGPDGSPLHPATVLREVLAEGELADRLGLDFFGVGEHHRDDYAVSAPDVLLAGLAARTDRIRLGTSVTVLSSDDPIRVFQRFSTVDAISNGRAEITVGRGSFVESFPLFGLDLSDYETLFEEKLDLLAAVVAEKPVHWEGSIRPPVDVQQVMPTTESGHLPVWVGVGGTPQSVVRAAHYGFPVVIAIIGGASRQFAPLADLYRQALSQMGKPERPVGVHSPGYVAATDEQAIDEFMPHFVPYMNKIGRERRWAPMTNEQALAQLGPDGAVYCGSPETVATKIVDTVRVLGVSRFQLKYSMFTLPHDQRMECIRLYAEEVVPRVRAMLDDA